MAKKSDGRRKRGGSLSTVPLPLAVPSSRGYVRGKYYCAADVFPELDGAAAGP